MIAFFFKIQKTRLLTFARVVTHVFSFTCRVADGGGGGGAVSVRWVTLFPLGSLLLLLLADVIAIVGHWTSRRALNFLSGILSVIGGTLLAHPAIAESLVACSLHG